MDSEQNRTLTSFPDDCLPPEGDYESRDALFAAINAWARVRGYAFINGKSTTEKNGRRTVTYMCDRRGKHSVVSKAARQRRTTSRRTGCEFSVLGKESLDKKTWALRHRFDKRFSMHNHEPSLDPTDHPILRALSKDDMATLASLTHAGMAPKEIRTYLRQSTNSLATQQDIYNRIADVRRGSCKGPGTISALVDQLSNKGFWGQFRTDSDGQVKAALFSHPSSIAELQARSDVPTLECTHKTNEYGMSILDMIVVDACGRSFCIAFACLSHEFEHDCFWALSRLELLYESNNIEHPRAIATDTCHACANAAATCFPFSSRKTKM